MKYFIMIILCAVAAVLLTMDRNASHASTERLQKAIGSDFVQALESESFTVFKILPKHHQAIEEKQEYEFTSIEHELDAAVTHAIRSCLLNDEHYYFDRTKKCEFIPEIGFRIQGEKERTIYASYCSKQIKFVDGHREILIDCDTMGEVMHQTFERALR